MTAPPTDPAPGKTIVLYDGHCAFCQRGVRILRRLDWLGRLHYQDARDVAHLPPCGDPLDPHKLLDEMHVVPPARRRARAGYGAMRWLAWQLPAGWAVAPLLYLPGVPWLGTRLYRWVARNRFKLVPCSHGVCQLPRR
jgi:predicted DCC family thiol-disulfide oxidoreductase YuxK